MVLFIITIYLLGWIPIIVTLKKTDWLEWITVDTSPALVLLVWPMLALVGIFIGLAGLIIWPFMKLDDWLKEK